MSLRSFVSFEADFSTDGQPPGKELADFIASALREKSLGCTGPAEREGWAWEVFWRAGNIQVESIIGFADDAPRQWLITTYSHVSFLRKIFIAGIEQEREKTLRQFCEAIDNALQDDGRFATIRWYTQQEFDGDYGDTWGEAP
jgi:hypothetical protein